MEKTIKLSLMCLAVVLASCNSNAAASTKPQSATVEKSSSNSEHEAIPNLSGEWIESFLNQPVGVARIEHDDNGLQFWNHQDPPKYSKGFIDPSGEIHANQWGLTAKVFANGNTLIWSNGVVWIRKSSI